MAVNELATSIARTVSILDPETGAAHYYDRGEFSEVAPADWNLQVVKNSADWYLGKIEHLPLALIESKQ